MLRRRDTRRKPRGWGPDRVCGREILARSYGSLAVGTAARKRIANRVTSGNLPRMTFAPTIVAQAACGMSWMADWDLASITAWFELQSVYGEAAWLGGDRALAV